MNVIMITDLASGSRPGSCKNSIMSIKNAHPLYYKVFVYGTLKKGEPNHYLLNETKNGHCRFITYARTVKMYPLVIASKYNIPFLISEEGIGKHIRGEIYEIDDVMLRVLDELENHPSYYTRRLEPVQILDDSRDIEQCWTYFLNSYRASLLELPYLEDYSSNGDHNLPYVERYRRSVGDYGVQEKEKVNVGGCREG